MNINSLLPKINEFRSIAKQPNASIFGFSESKLDPCNLNCEVDIKNYHLIRMDSSRRGGRVASCIRKSLSQSHKPNFCHDIESFFIDIFLPKPCLFRFQCYTSYRTNLNLKSTLIIPTPHLFKNMYGSLLFPLPPSINYGTNENNIALWNTYRTHFKKCFKKNDSEWCYWNEIFWSWAYIVVTRIVTFEIKWTLWNFI